MISLPLPIVISVVCGAFFIGSVSGYSIRDNAAKLSAAKAYKAYEQRRLALEEKINVVSSQYEAERAKHAVVGVERINTVREFYRTGAPVPSVCGLSDAVYGLLANSVADANAAASGELGARLPKTADAAQTRD